MGTRVLLASAFAIMLAGITILAVGINSYFVIQETEQRLAELERARSSVPAISYENLGDYFGTSTVLFVTSGFLFVWRNRK